jgi:CRISPR-associated protein Cas2
MDLLVTYDIETVTVAGQKRLARVAKVCEGFGVRVQKSVFECRVTSVRYAQLVGALSGEIVPKRDSVNIYRFAGALAEARVSLGRRPDFEPGGVWIV